MSVQPEKRIVTVAGNRIAYLQAGTGGEPVLLVHGITTYSFIWQDIIPLLAAEYQVFVPDLLGCGDSDKPLDQSYALREHARRIGEFAAALGIEKCHYVGHDLGGGIGQIVAVNQPGLLYSLTLINSVGYDFWPVQPIISMRTPIIRQLMMASLDLGAFKMIVQRGVYHRERITPAMMDTFRRPMQTGAGRKAFLHFTRCLDNRDLTSLEEDLRSIQMPVLIIRGEADVYLSSLISEKLHREIPGSKLVRIATSGHFLQIDEPEILAQTIAAFLKDQRGQPG